MKNFPLAFLLSAFTIACTNGITEDPRDLFLNNYIEYCGHAYPGETRFIDLGENHPLDGAALVMVLSECSAEAVRIPFMVNGDSSRTWIVMQTPQGLYLTHDHRYADGTQHANNFYGGYAGISGSSTRQFFPSDHRTILDRPVRAANVWSKEFDHDSKIYYYRLYLHGELRYEAAFDLSAPFDAADLSRPG
jgi:hypothetical protein